MPQLPAGKSRNLYTLGRSDLLLLRRHKGQNGCTHLDLVKPAAFSLPPFHFLQEILDHFLGVAAVDGE